MMTQDFTDPEQVRHCAFSQCGDYYCYIKANDIHLIDFSKKSGLVNLQGVLEEPIPVYKTYNFSCLVTYIAFCNRGFFVSKKTKDAPNAGVGRRKASIHDPRTPLLAIGFVDGIIRILDVSLGETVMVLKDHVKAITGMSFPRDGSLRLATTSMDGSSKLWDLLDDGILFKTLANIKPLAMLSVAFSPNGQLICTTGEKNYCMLWKASTCEVIMNLECHRHNVTDCHFSSNNSLLFTASLDTTVVVWDMISKVPLKRLWHMGRRPSIILLGGGNDFGVLKVIPNKDNTHIMTLCIDSKLRLWELDSQNEYSSKTAQTMTYVLQGDKSKNVMVNAVLPEGYDVDDDVITCGAFNNDGTIFAYGTKKGLVAFNSPFSTLTSGAVPTLASLARTVFRSHYWNFRYAELLNYYKATLKVSDQVLNFLNYGIQCVAPPQ
jgi:WD40 repeat protein